MNPLILLGAAIALLVFAKKPAAAAPVVLSGGPSSPPEPTFTDVVLTPKTKEPTAIVAIGPVADGSMPPYVTQATPEFSSFGTLELDRMV